MMTIAGGLLAAGLLAGAGTGAWAQGLEAQKARPFSAPDLSDTRRAAGAMPDAVAKAAPAPRTPVGLDFKPYEGEYELVASQSMSGNRCARAVKVERRGSFLVISGKAGQAFEALSEFDLSLLEPLANAPRPGDYVMYRLTGLLRDGSVVLNEFTEGSLNERATFTADGLYKMDLSWQGECVYRRASRG
ncbi:MAG: hypothetical protein PHF00_08240 [Elusimicrobia bacterium]|nr:hypothetical protein [Elusimicrobiota bacterium]